MISEFMLNDSATVKVISGRTADRKPQYSEETVISKVYFDLARFSSDGSNGKTESDNGKLYFDCVNSRPVTFTPVKDMIVIFENVQYTVTTFKKCKGINGLEHYEIDLK